MHPNTIEPQAPPESRTEKVGLAVTPTEKAAVRALAALRGTDESNLVRGNLLADIVTDFLRLQQQAGGRSSRPEVIDQE